MQQIKEYTIVMGKTPKDLIAKVNEMISEGWQPIGGVVVTQGPVVQSPNPNYVMTETFSHQTMVR